MKYLDDLAPPLHLLSTLLSFDDPSAHVRVRTSIDAYSCKPIARERKLFRNLDNSLLDDLSLASSMQPGQPPFSADTSPNPNPNAPSTSTRPQAVPSRHPKPSEAPPDAAATPHLSVSPPTFSHPSPFGPLDNRTARRTLWDLVGTLNCAFPDHDFSRVRPDEFVRALSASDALAPLSNALYARSGPGVPAGFGLADDDQLGERLFSFSSSFPPPGLEGQSPVMRPQSPSAQAPQPFSLGPSQITHGGSNSPKLDENGGTRSLSPTSNPVPLHPLLRTVLDPMIDLNECEAYSYSPEAECDPHADDTDSDTEINSDEAEGEADNPPMTYGRMDGGPGAGWSQRHRTREERDNASSADDESEREWDLEVDLDDMDMDMDMDGVPVPAAGAAASRTKVPRANRKRSSPSKARHSRKTGRDRNSQGGILFSTNYFLVNRKMKRIVFVSLWGRKISPFASASSPSTVGSLPAAMASASAAALSRSLPGPASAFGHARKHHLQPPNSNSSSGGGQRRRGSASSAVEGSTSKGSLAKARARKAPATVRVNATPATRTGARH